MEDDNGLELSLGLTCGASSAVSKGKIGSSSDTRIKEGNKGIKIVDDFKNFLQAGTQKQDPSVASQRSDAVKPSGNFFNDLSRASSDQEAGSKRKMSFDEINDPKKLEREAHRIGLHENPKTSHISMKTEDGSTAEHEDVAESEVEGSNDYGSKIFIGVSGSSEVPVVKLGNLNDGMNVPSSLPTKDSNTVRTLSSDHTLPGMIQIMPTGNSERSATQPVDPRNLPFMLGYSAVQLPVLDKENPWGTVSHPPHIHPSNAGRGPTNPDKHCDEAKKSQATVHTIARNSFEDAEYDSRRTVEQGEGKLHASREDSATPSDEDVKGINVNLGANAASNQPTAGGLSLDFSAIKPGIAADVKFGGCGSRPNLPWVSTTGTGPHGRTISGVTYRLGANQVKIVCACHGTHMSLEEFIRHASEDCTNPVTNIDVATKPSTTPVASTRAEA